MGVACLLTIGAAIGLAWWPCSYSGASFVYETAGLYQETTTCASLVAVNGLAVLGVFAVPVVLAALVLLAVRREARTLGLAAATVLVLFSLAGAASIGVFFLPAAAASTVAAAIGPR